MKKCRCGKPLNPVWAGCKCHNEDFCSARCYVGHMHGVGVCTCLPESNCGIEKAKAGETPIKA